MFRRFLLFLILLNFGFLSNAQVITFEKKYDTLGFYHGNCVKQTVDSGFIISGYRVYSTPTFSTNVGTVVKTDKWGNIQWAKSFFAFFNSIELLNDTTYLLAGAKQGSMSNVYFLLLNNNGDSIWSSTTTLIYDDHNINNSIRTRDHGFAFTGTCPLAVDSPGHILLIKTNQSLTIEWTKIYSINKISQGNGLVQTDDGGFAITGLCSDFSNADIFIARTDSIGNLLWQKSFGYNNVDVAFSIAQSSDKGFVMGGYSWVTLTNDYDAFLLKTDSSGNYLWDNQIGNALENVCYHMEQLPNGEIVLAGSTATPSNSSDVWFAKTDNAGNLIGNRVFGNTSGEFGRYIIRTSDNGYAIVGDSNTPQSIYLIKTDSMSSTWIGVPDIENAPFSVYPNPSNGLIRLIYPSGYHDKVMYEILDITGKMLVPPTHLSNSPLIDLSHLASGIYLINVVVDENRWIKKLVIQH